MFFFPQHELTYIITSTAPQDGLEYFYLNPFTGMLSVRKPLDTTQSDTYTVRLTSVLFVNSFDTAGKRLQSQTIGPTLQLRGSQASVI